MKLYTENSIRDILSNVFMDDSIDYIINKLTPIELPTELEIASIRLSEYLDFTKDPYNSELYNLVAFRDGIKWLKEQINKQL